jgi:predicted Zn-dependent protease
MIMRLISMIFFLGFSLAGLPRGFAQDVGGIALPELGDVSSAVISPQAERRIGEEAMRQIRARDPNYLDDPEIAEYLNTLGKKLVGAGSGASQDFEFFGIRDDTINAFAMPGGYVGVHTGLLLAAQTESELASVLAHEISHVTQHHIARLVGKQNQLSTIGIAGLLVALLAARSGSDLGQAALIATQGGAIQAQLGYTRDFEREADRIGFQVLQRAGFDTNGMVSFFDRLQKATRTYENNAPAYLRSHPLTGERIADIQNRVQGSPYRQHLDSIEFHLVRAKLRSEQGIPRDALVYFQGQLEGKRYSSEAGARYGLVSSLIRSKDFKRAEAELRRLRALVPHNAMVDLLAVRIREASGDASGAADLAKAALLRQPGNRPLNYANVHILQSAGRHQEALAHLADLVRSYPRDSQVYLMQARSYAATGQNLLRHRAQAEAYYLQGAVPAAIEQLQLAQKANDGDFYQLSSVEARMRELRQAQALERSTRR